MTEHAISLACSFLLLRFRKAVRCKPNHMSTGEANDLRWQLPPLLRFKRVHGKSIMSAYKEKGRMVARRLNKVPLVTLVCCYVEDAVGRDLSYTDRCRVGEAVCRTLGLVDLQAPERECRPTFYDNLEFALLQPRNEVDYPPEKAEDVEMKKAAVVRLDVDSDEEEDDDEENENM